MTPSNGDLPPPPGRAGGCVQSSIITICTYYGTLGCLLPAETLFLATCHNKHFNHSWPAAPSSQLDRKGKCGRHLTAGIHWTWPPRPSMTMTTMEAVHRDHRYACPS